MHTKQDVHVSIKDESHLFCKWGGGGMCKREKEGQYIYIGPMLHWGWIGKRRYIDIILNYDIVVNSLQQVSAMK